MSKYIYCDFESQSTIDLKKQGSKVYIQHPHTRIMSGVFIVDNKVTIWVPKHIQADLSKYPLPVDRSADFPAHILQLAKTHTFVAHNAELFDKWLIEEKYPYRFNWLDTIHYCRAAGLPGALGKVLDILFGINKLDNLAMLMLCEAKVRNGKPVYPVGNFAIWKKMLDYNVQDVKHLPKIMDYLTATGVIEAERENVKRHEEINARGFKVNRDLVVLLRKLWGELQERAVDEVYELTDKQLKEKDLFSPIKVKNYLQSLGYGLNTLNAQVVNQIIARPEDFLEGDDAASMLALLMIRKNAIRATPGKLDRMLAELDDDDVARRSIVFYGAHTGRPTGRGINPLNFPRGTKLGVLDKAKDYTLDNLLCKLQNGTGNLSTITEYAKANSNEKVKVNEGDILNTLTRNCLIPHGDMFHIADMSQIEARLAAKLANCKTLLDAFADPKRDVYCEYGTVQFGRVITAEDEVERYVSKTIVLGSNYGMGHRKLAMMCQIFGIDLEKVGLTAKACIDTYRKTYPEIKRLWHKLQDACTNAVQCPGVEFEAGYSKFKLMKNYQSTGIDFLRLTLPSGRNLWYRDCYMETTPAPWNDQDQITQPHYTTSYNFRRSLYGGILAENICQATGRDIQCLAKLKLGKTVLDVYDELCGEDDLETLVKAMSTVPKWLKGLPIEAKGFSAPCYSKEKFKNSAKLTAINGVLQ